MAEIDFPPHFFGNPNYRDGTPYETTQTVFYEGHRDADQLVLSKATPDPWGSKFIPHGYKSTPHGDPRSPIFVLGARLAKLFKFRYEMSADGKRQILRIPTAPFLEATVRRANRHLKEKIPYLPTKTHYVSPEEVLRMSVRNAPDFLLTAPYEDSSPKLTIHEASNHLSGIVMSRAALKRAFLINEKTLSLIDHLRQAQTLNHQSKLARVIFGLIQHREFEVDAGMANFFGYIAKLRSALEMKSYTEILSLAKDNDFEIAGRSLEQLVHPTMQPLEAVVDSLTKITGIPDFEFDGPTTRRQRFFALFKTTEEPILALTSDEKRELTAHVRVWLSEQRSEPQEYFARLRPASLVIDILSGLDQRLADIEEALSIEEEP